MRVIFCISFAALSTIKLSSIKPLDLGACSVRVYGLKGAGLIMQTLAVKTSAYRFNLFVYALSFEPLVMTALTMRMKKATAIMIFVS